MPLKTTRGESKDACNSSNIMITIPQSMPQSTKNQALSRNKPPLLMGVSKTLNTT